MFAETKIKEPYSPIARENPKVTPVIKAGKRGGKSTFVNVTHGEAPSDQAASSTSISISCNTGCIVRTTKGKETNTIALAIPNLVYITCTPNCERNLPITLLGLYTVANVRPATDVGIAKGRSIAASNKRFPTKLYLTKTHARINPRTPLNKEAKRAILKVTVYAERAIG